MTSWSHALVAMVVLFVAACSREQAPAPPLETPLVLDPVTREPMRAHTLDDVQGCWWMDCGQPHAEFCLDGSRVHGDFENDGAAAVAANRLMVVFPGGQSLSERIVEASRERLVLDGTAGRITYVTCP